MEFDLDSEEMSEPVSNKSDLGRSIFSLRGTKFSIVGGRKGSVLIPKANWDSSSMVSDVSVLL